VKVTVNARQRVDLTLQVGAITDSVLVTGAAKLVETDSSDRGTVIATEQIVNLPLNGRAYADLALLSPGVRRSDISARDASFNVHGLRSSLNNFTMDGVDNNSYGTSNQGFSNQVVQASPDSVSEFKVQTNNYSAEFGRAGGAVINASMRAGTNQIRGSAWEFHRNTVLNAVGFFKPSKDVAGNPVKPTLIRNQFGFAAGGPVIKDKAFWFIDYEGFRQIQRSIRFASIPTVDMRNGILGKAIRNPITGETYATQIPSSAIIPFARKVLADLPAPTRSGIANNYDSLPAQKNYNDKFDIKLDYQLSSKVSSFVRLSHRKMNNFEPPTLSGMSGGDANGNLRVLNQQLATGATYTMSPTRLAEFRLGISKTDAGKEPIGKGGPGMGDYYGLSGFPTDARFAGGLAKQSISGWTALGRQESNPQFQNPFVWNPKVNYSWIMGRMNWKFGYEYQNIATEIDDVHPKYGQDTYSGQFTRPSGAASDSATYNLSDFLLGLRSTYTIISPFIFNLRQRMHFFYAQNDWKVDPKLTLNMGLRYEIGSPQWEKDNYLTNFDPGTKTLLASKNGSIYDKALVHPDRNNFAPRFGIAYTPTARTVIRAGYGISYVHFNRLGGENLLAFNGPHVVQITINQLTSQAACVGNQNPTTCFRNTQQGYPTGYTVPGVYDPLKARVNFIPANTRTGYVQSWHLTTQWEVLPNLLIDLGYIGNKSTKLVILGDYNQARPNNVGESLSLQARRPLQNFSVIQEAFPGGMGNYHAMQAKIERRFTSGLYLLNSFTWSKGIDNVSGHLEANNGDNSRINFTNMQADKGLSGYDQPFNNTTSAVWDLPYGHGRKFGANVHPVIDGILGGWRLTGINTMTSGVPINLSYTPTSAQTVSDYPTYRPNISGSLYSAEKSITNYFDKNSITVPTEVNKPFGNAGRNIARSHPFYQLDMGLHKDFRLMREQNRLEFRAEFFNLFNRTNFQNANSNRSSSSFGTISGTYPARQIQFGLKLYF
jgi:hypothetical protein